MLRKQGFTLVELLVVIAIIGILASIAVPGMVGHMRKARFTKAQAEIRSIDTSLTALLADAGVKNFRHFLRSDQEYLIDGSSWGLSGVYTPREFAKQVDKNITQYNNTGLLRGIIDGFYTPIFYELLKNGKSIASDDIKIALRPEVLDKLSDSGYLDIGKDPWGEHLYKFYAGPVGARISYIGGEAIGEAVIPFRIRSVDLDIPGVVTDALTDRLEGLDGYPAAAKLPAYVFSFGSDLEGNQPFYDDNGYEILTWDDELDEPYFGGGDDVNNWDSGGSWYTGG